MQGQITKGIAGFYYVKSGETVYRCKARGIFKQQGIKPAVGDRVRFEIIEGNDDNLITQILPRKNCFIRPFVANVDCFAVVTALLRPAPVQPLLDKLLIMAERAEAEIILCINKCDLTRTGSRSARGKAVRNLDLLRSIYEPVYPLVLLDQTEEEGFDRLREKIRGRRTALAGASGVGKSTILNRLLQQEHMQTGEISEKTQRGKHTTRHAELFLMEDGTTGIFDTPGFTSFNLEEMEPDQLQQCFPEIRDCPGTCRFDDCRHAAEPECRIKAAVEQGRIGRQRYDSYRSILKELEDASQY